MGIDTNHLTKALVEGVLFTGVGLVAFVLAFWVVQKIVPFSLHKEIEDDQNVAVGIVLGAIVIGIAMIISAAIGG